MIVASSAKQSGRRSWWRLRFSLRALLLLTAVLCVSLGLSFSSARRQQWAVEAIEAVGGRVSYNWQYDLVNDTWRYDRAPPGTAWLRKLLGSHYFDTVISATVGRYGRGHVNSRLAEIAPHLAALSELKSLFVLNFKLTDADFARLGQLSRLEELSLREVEITDEGAARLGSLVNLRELTLTDVIISAKAIREFKSLPNLECFHLCCRHLDHGPHGAPLWRPDKYAIRDDALDALPDFPRLRRLSLVFTLITDEGMATLSRLTQLEALEVSSPHITNASMPNLVKLINLESLGLLASSVDEEGVEMLTAFPKLTSLDISGKTLTNACLPHLAKMHHLKRLTLGSKKIDDDGLKHLHGMSNLAQLDVQSTAVTTDGQAVKQLKLALPNCRIHQYYPSPSFR